MLVEVGLIHDIFQQSSYPSPELCDLHLKGLKDALLRRAVVRDFRDGEWRAYFSDPARVWDLRARELVKKLIQQKRLIPARPALPQSPASEIDWCKEAIASNQLSPFAGVIASNKTASHFDGNQLVSAIEKLNQAPWWNDTFEAVRLHRKSEDYLKHLRLILQSANLLMFIDPHLDPSRNDYSEFVQILLASKRPHDRQAMVQVHRVCYVGQGAARQILKLEEWHQRFEPLQEPLANAGLRIEVFFWDHFHDRHLVTDLVGILMGNGFDVAGNLQETTTWARISRDVREAIQREFDPNSLDHRLHARFFVGAAF